MPSSLSRILLSAPGTEGLVSELATLLETHIASKRGVTGMAMKAGFSTLRAAKPDIAARAVRALLPDIAKALEPLHAQFHEAGHKDFGAFLGQHAEHAASLVMHAADARIGNSENATAKALYKRFRSTAADDLQTLMPLVGRAIGTQL